VPEISTNPRLTDALLERLEEIWLQVSRAGGAVGFPPSATRADVEAGAAPLWDQVLDGTLDLAVAEEGGRAVGFGFLRRGTTPVERHRGEVVKLQRDPAVAGRGVGAAVLRALESVAVERGLTLLTLQVREGAGRESWYAGLGYEVAARLPGWVQVEGEEVALLVMQKRLDGRGPAAPAAAAPALHAGPATGSVALPVVRLDPGLPLPAYARPGDAGLDLHARERRVLPAGVRALMPTGVAVAIPVGHVGLVHPRSGLAVRHGLSIVNAPGTIDAGYRGEVIVPLINLDPSASIRIERGDRIAQLLVQRVERAQLVEVEALPDGVRGTGGFGSTGR
jgi:dUTP pyrophosphatase